MCVMIVIIDVDMCMLLFGVVICVICVCYGCYGYCWCLSFVALCCALRSRCVLLIVISDVGSCPLFWCWL